MCQQNIQHSIYKLCWTTTFCSKRRCTVGGFTRMKLFLLVRIFFLFILNQTLPHSTKLFVMTQFSRISWKSTKFFIPTKQKLFCGHEIPRVSNSKHCPTHRFSNQTIKRQWTKCGLLVGSQWMTESLTLWQCHIVHEEIDIWWCRKLISI